VGGAKVQQVASGLHTPTSFAVGAGNLFEGDGGAEGNGPPAGGGVYVLKGGKGTLIPGSPQFVAGLAWREGALYVSGGYFTAKGPKWQLLVERLERHDLHQAQDRLHRPAEVPRLQRHRVRSGRAAVCRL
jgi:hypothetical protein